MDYRRVREEDFQCESGLTGVGVRQICTKYANGMLGVHFVYKKLSDWCIVTDRLNSIGIIQN
jgi:hypothetical protein